MARSRLRAWAGDRVRAAIDRSIPPSLRHGEADRVRRARLLVAFVWVLIAFAAIGIGLVFTVGLVSRQMAWAALVAIAGALLVPPLLRRTGAVDALANFVVLLFFQTCVTDLLVSGMLMRHTVYLLAVVPLVALLLASRVAGIAWALAAFVAMTAVYAMQELGHAFAPPPPVGDLARLTWVSATFQLALLLGLGLSYEFVKNNALRALERANRELDKARAAAVAAGQARTAFLATMSHEIRTPMNAVIGMTGFLLGTRLDGEQRECLETIRVSGESLLAIINDILDFSKIESGKLELDLHEVELEELVGETVDIVAVKAREKGLDLAYSLGPGAPSRVRADGTRLRQILLNLLSNAIKFTEKGEVLVRVSSRGLDDGRSELHFSVRDTGIGIPFERLDRLFRSFSQVDSSTTRKYGGTGLGLAISKRLAERMGGRMWVESTPGAGSTFHFTAQVEPLAEAEPRTADDASALSGRRVLVVDDNPTNREIVQRQLEARGVRASAVASGREAIAQLRRERFDAAILDYLMPGMDGVQLARALRGDERTRATPLVLLTSASNVPAGLAHGPGRLFSSILTKPSRPEQLVRALVAAVAPEAAHSPAPVTATEPAESAPSRLCILLAEDNAVNQKVACKLLQRLGYQADVAANGLEALEAVRGHRYDVVLMDVQMPLMDGIEATRRLRRELSPRRQPRIVAMTANATAEDREACLSAGMDDYLSKPVTLRDLEAALARCAPLANEPAWELAG